MWNLRRMYCQFIKLASTGGCGTYHTVKQQRLRSVCAYVHNHQSHSCSYTQSIDINNPNLHLHGWKFSGLFLNSGFWGWLSMASFKIGVSKVQGFIHFELSPMDLVLLDTSALVFKVLVFCTYVIGTKISCS